MTAGQPLGGEESQPKFACRAWLALGDQVPLGSEGRINVEARRFPSRSWRDRRTGLLADRKTAHFLFCCLFIWNQPYFSVVVRQPGCYSAIDTKACPQLSESCSFPSRIRSKTNTWAGLGRRRPTPMYQKRNTLLNGQDRDFWRNPLKPRGFPRESLFAFFTTALSF